MADLAPVTVGAAANLVTAMAAAGLTARGRASTTAAGDDGCGERRRPRQSGSGTASGRRPWQSGSGVAGGVRLVFLPFLNLFFLPKIFSHAAGLGACRRKSCFGMRLPNPHGKITIFANLFTHAGRPAACENRRKSWCSHC